MASVTRAQAQKGLKGQAKQEDSATKNALIEADGAAVEILGRKQFFDLQGHWSWAIMTWISALIIFNIILTYKVGIGCWNFANLQWFITTVIVETFLQIVGLGYIAAKFLFSK